MLCKHLKIVNLNITEDFYDYKGVFRLCSDDKCLEVDLADLDNDSKINEIKSSFQLEEDTAVITKIIMDRIMEATKIHTKIVEGENYNKSLKDEENERRINSLDRA